MVDILEFLQPEVSHLTHEHPLKKVKVDGEWRCRGTKLYENHDTCREKDPNNKYKYVCSKCKDLEDISYCSSCVNRKDSTFKTRVHDCILTHHTYDGWNCNGRQQKDGCRQEKVGLKARHLRNIPGFGCRTCDWDLCDRCLIYYNS